MDGAWISDGLRTFRGGTGRKKDPSRGAPSWTSNATFLDEVHHGLDLDWHGQAAMQETIATVETPLRETER